MRVTDPPSDKPAKADGPSKPVATDQPVEAKAFGEDMVKQARTRYRNLHRLHRPQLARYAGAELSAIEAAAEEAEYFAATGAYEDAVRVFDDTCQFILDAAVVARKQFDVDERHRLRLQRMDRARNAHAQVLRARKLAEAEEAELHAPQLWQEGLDKLEEGTASFDQDLFVDAADAWEASAAAFQGAYDVILSARIDKAKAIYERILAAHEPALNTSGGESWVEARKSWARGVSTYNSGDRLAALAHFEEAAAFMEAAEAALEDQRTP